MSYHIDCDKEKQTTQTTSANYVTHEELDAAVSVKSNVGHTHPIEGVVGLAEELAAKAALSHTHPTSDITGLEEAITEVTTTKMNRDGSNYQGSLTLVPPSITSQWIVKKQDGTQVSTSAANSLSLENGAKVDYAGSFSYPAPDSTQKAPTACSGSFGTTLPAAGVQSDTLSKTDLTTNTSLSVSLYSPKSGLEVANGRVVVASGNDTTSATAAVSFSHRRYWGVSADAAIDITQLSDTELSNSRAKSIQFNCSGGRYFYYAYPKALGNSTWSIGGLSFTGYTRTEQTITNAYGKSVEYYIYRSTELQTGSSINAVIS